jgi:hypothetical protein
VEEYVVVVIKWDCGLVVSRMDSRDFKVMAFASFDLFIKRLTSSERLAGLAMFVYLQMGHLTE